MRSMHMIKVREILRLKSLGMGIRATAESCKCSRNTAREILRTAEIQGLSWPLPEDMDDAQLMKLIYPSVTEPANRKPEPDYAYIHEELKRPHVNLRLLWTEFRDQQPDGLGYSQFCNLYRNWAAKTKATMHLEHKPGYEMFVDWAGSKMQVTNADSGEVIPAHLFVSTIGASAYPYVEAFPSECLENWITAHIHAFRHYGGIPQMLVPDNLKTGVKRACSYDPELNKTYRDLSEHYGCAIVPARPHKPKDKPMAEGTVGDISTWIIAALRNQRFFSFHELNLSIRDKLQEYSRKPFQKKDGTRESVFLELDLPALKPLPAKDYEMATWKVATVSFNYHIEVEKMYYSVPYAYIKKKVDVKITPFVIEVYSNHLRICSHQKLHGKAGQYATQIEHMPSNHKEYLSWNGDRFLAWACKIGDHTRELVQQVLTSRKVEQQAYKSCFGLLKLADRYSAFRLENACQRALQLKSPSYTTVNNILKNGMDKVAEVEESASKSKNVIPIHSRIRGAQYYAQGGHRQ